MSKCIGCGISLQNTNKDDLGYTPSLDNKYCERCFKTIHYNVEKKIANIDNTKIINHINKLELMTIFITDLISLNQELMKYFNMIKNQKVLVINKCDIIPNNLKLEHLEENIKRVYKLDSDVFFIGAKDKMYLNKIIDLITKNKKVILVGETSSGKSTLINNLTGSNLTTSKYSNTTLDFIKIKYDEFIIYDSPGLLISKKMPLNNLKLVTKNLSNDFCLTIDNIKLKGEGNITCLMNKDVIISSKKDQEKLSKEYIIAEPTDIIFNNSFIFIKKGVIYSNADLELRKSIIKM